MKKESYQSMETALNVTRRNFLKASGTVGTGLILGTPTLWAQEKKKGNPKPKTNIDEIIKIPKTELSLPGKFPGKVVEVHNSNALENDQPNKKIVQEMFVQGIKKLADNSMKKSYKMLFKKDDIIGIKVNPVGAGLISTRLEVVDAVIEWLVSNGTKKENIIIEVINCNE